MLAAKLRFLDLSDINPKSSIGGLYSVFHMLSRHMGGPSHLCDVEYDSEPGNQDDKERHTGGVRCLHPRFLGKVRPKNLRARAAQKNNPASSVSGAIADLQQRVAAAVPKPVAYGHTGRNSSNADRHR